MARTREPVEIRVESHIPELVGILQTQIRRKVYAMGTTVREKLLTEVLVGERYGFWYQVPGSKRMYRASRRGEAPATRTGDLRRSYKVGQVQGEGVDTHVQVGSALPYAPILETEIERPHLVTALALAGPDIEAILRGDWGI